MNAEPESWASTTTSSDFQTTLRKHFRAGGLPPAESARLEAAWRALLADRVRSSGVDLLFAPLERVADGLSWWEERQRGEPGLVRPITDLDRACMMLSVDPTLRAPAPRPYCPEDMLGTWVVTEVSTDNKTLSPAPRCHELTLDGGGTLLARPPRRGFGWRVHRGTSTELWLGPVTAPRTDIFTIVRRDGNTMDVMPPGVWRGFERWTRRR